MVTAVAAVIILACRDLLHDDLFNVFLWSGVIGTLILLVAYILATLGRSACSGSAAPQGAASGRSIFPVLALLVLVATIYYNVDPDAPAAFRWNYYTAGIWVLLGVVLVVALPGSRSASASGSRRTGPRRGRPRRLGYSAQPAGR